jgi:hypothetical protein
VKIVNGRFNERLAQREHKVADAIELSVKSTVKIADEDWFKEIAETIDRSKARVREAAAIDALLSYLVQALAQLVFIQLGNFPERRLAKTTPLTPEWWTLTRFRRAGSARRIAAED